MIEIDDDRKNNYVDAIRKWASPKIDVSFCILPNLQGSIWAIRKMCSVEVPFLHNVLLPSRFLLLPKTKLIFCCRSLLKPKALMSVRQDWPSNNCKLGGELWKLEYQFSFSLINNFTNRSLGGKRWLLYRCLSWYFWWWSICSRVLRQVWWYISKYYSRASFQRLVKNL